MPQFCPEIHSQQALKACLELLHMQAVMTDPVMLRGEPDGQSYERRYLEAHLEHSR